MPHIGGKGLNRLKKVSVDFTLVDINIYTKIGRGVEEPEEKVDE
jgi:hypothetical protein